MAENKNLKHIYCFTNLINQKKYIGSTINEPHERYRGHLYHATHETNKSNYPLYLAIKKYGIENFNFEVLFSIECSETEIRKIEKEYILKLNTLVPNGYNQTLNTEHPLQDSASYAKMSETKREKATNVAMLNLEKKLLGIYRSIADCAEATGYSERKIAACCRGERKSTNNRIFYWLDENEQYIIPKYTRDIYKGERGTTQQQITNKKVLKISLNTNEILEVYSSIALAARENSCDASAISKVCKGKRNKCGGFKWQYQE